MTHEPYEHGPLVEAWLKEPTWLPETDLARVSTLIRQSPQRRSWLPRPGLGRSRFMLSATTIVAGIAAVALTGGVLLNGLAPRTPQDGGLTAAGAEASLAIETSTASAATTEPTLADAREDGAVRLRLPETLPDGAWGGSIDTPAGPARWMRSTAPAGDLPLLSELGSWGDGLAILDNRAGSLWTTSDGTDWQRVPLPVDLDADRPNDGTVDITRAAEAHYLLQSNRNRIWRHEVGSTWTPLDISEVASARPTGWSTETSFDGPRMVDGEPVFDITYRYQLPRKRLGIHRGPVTAQMHRIADDRYALCPQDNAKCSAKDAVEVIRFKPTDDGLVVRDDRTGERYGLLAGAEASQLYEGHNSSQHQAFALEGDALVPVDLPGRKPERAVDEAPPPGLPAKASPRRLDSGWVAFELADRIVKPGQTPQPTSWWMHFAGSWVDLSELELPDLVPYVTQFHQAGIGNTTLFRFEDPQRDWAGLWIITAPEGA